VVFDYFPLVNAVVLKSRIKSGRMRITSLLNDAIIRDQSRQGALGLLPHRNFSFPSTLGTKSPWQLTPCRSRTGRVFFAPVDVLSWMHKTVVTGSIFVAKRERPCCWIVRASWVPPEVVGNYLARPAAANRYEQARELYARFGLKEFWLADVASSIE